MAAVVFTVLFPGNKSQKKEIRTVSERKDQERSLPARLFLRRRPARQIMDGFFAFRDKKNLVPAGGRVYNLESIRDAVADRDEGKVNGRIVVRIQQEQCRDGETK